MKSFPTSSSLSKPGGRRAGVSVGHSSPSKFGATMSKRPKIEARLNIRMNIKTNIRLDSCSTEPFWRWGPQTVPIEELMLPILLLSERPSINGAKYAWIPFLHDGLWLVLKGCFRGKGFTAWHAKRPPNGGDEQKRSYVLSFPSTWEFTWRKTFFLRILNLPLRRDKLAGDDAELIRWLASACWSSTISIHFLVSP